MMEIIRFVNDCTGLIHLIGLVVFIIFTVVVIRRLNKISDAVLTCKDYLEILRSADFNYEGKLNAIARLINDAFEYQKTVWNINSRRIEEDMKKELGIFVSNIKSWEYL